jgi:3',5'-nucleoside bisphosphate phosphatase
VSERLTYQLADLHVHTVLSPCAELEMLPPLVIDRARRLGLSILGVTDHNSCENSGAMMIAGARAGIAVLPGMEVQTREEVHLLCLFDTLTQAQQWQERVYAHLPDQLNREEVFGSQLVVDAEGEFVRFNARLLLTSTNLSVEEVCAYVSGLGGIVIPSHVDRPAYSLIANLGLIPAGLELAAVEVTARLTPDEARRRFPQLRHMALVYNGDAHRLSEMQNRSLFRIAAPRIEELYLACRNEQGRRLIAA